MKIALAQLNYHIGNFDSNADKIRKAIYKAKTQGVDLVVFAELAISGYPPRDFLEFNGFLEQCQKRIEEIAKECIGIAAIVGSPSINALPKGKRLHNSAYFLNNGMVEHVIHKSLLPTYDIFDEYRYFEPGLSSQVISYQGKKIGITICEDIWNVRHDGLYPNDPVEDLMKHQPDFIINIAASPFSVKHYEKRTDILQQNALKYKIPFFYVNHVGAQTELIFDGNSMVVAGSGEVLSVLPQFAEGSETYDTEAMKRNQEIPNPEKFERIEKALILGISDYFRKLNFEKAVVGLSGGIDSAVTMALAARALGKDHVLAILMPSQFSSDHSVSDAEKLCKNLGCSYEIIPIEKAYQTYSDLLSTMFEGKPFDVTEENIQARIRATLLMAISNKFGNILLNTSNKSEFAVGYSTLYGDMSGGLSVLGDVYKTEVYELAHYLNRDEEVIPENIIVKPASAELRPDQKDTDSLPEYEILDEVLVRYIEKSMDRDAIIREGFSEALVKRVLKLVNTTEYKRFQAPPVLRISDKAFGMGRRMPIVGKYHN